MTEQIYDLAGHEVPCLELEGNDASRGIPYRVYGPAHSSGHIIQGDQHAGRDIIIHFGETDKQRLLRWLSSTQYRAHHQTMARDLLPQSGAWLFDSIEYRTWEPSQASCILWLHGIPGSGKSKLVSVVVNHLLKVIAHENADVDSPEREISLAYFYCEKNRAEADRSDPDNILRCILKQLAISSVKDRSVHAAVKAEWSRCCVELEETGLEPARLRADECERLILDILHDRSAYIVLDGLDECDHGRRHELLLAIDRLIQRAAKTVKFFVSSRDDEDIVCRLERSPNIIIQAKDNRFDIERFVREKIDQAIEEKRILKGKVSLQLKKYIISAILAKAQGMFRWVSLKIQALCDFQRIKHEKDVREELDLLPTSLSELYNRTYDQVLTMSTTGRVIAVQALRWLLYSPRPLSTKELISAVILSLEERTQTNLDIKDILDMCCSLIIHDEQLDTFRFAHLTVREYLETRPEYSKVDIHNMALNVCLDTYAALLLNWGTSYSLSAPYRIFRDYAMGHWVNHYKALYDEHPRSVHRAGPKVKSLLEKIWENPRIVEELSPELPKYNSLSDCKSTKFQVAAIRMRSSWMPSSKKKGGHVPCEWDSSVTTDIDMLQYSIERELYNGRKESNLRTLEDETTRETSEKPHRTRLSFAAEAGHLNTFISEVKMEPKLIDLADEHGRTPFSYASGAGHERILMEIQHNLTMSAPEVDVSAQDENGRSAMWWAIQNGHETVAWLLRGWPGLCQEDRDMFREKAPAWFVREKIVRHLQPTLHPKPVSSFLVSSETYRSGTPKYFIQR